MRPQCKDIFGFKPSPCDLPTTKVKTTEDKIEPFTNQKQAWVV